LLTNANTSDLADCDGNSNFNRNGDSYGFCHVDGYTHSDISIPDGHADCYGYSYSDSDIYCHSDSDSHRNCDGNCHRDG
jgi:hypothetical protein